MVLLVSSGLHGATLWLKGQCLQNQLSARQLYESLAWNWGLYFEQLSFKYFSILNFS